MSSTSPLGGLKSGGQVMATDTTPTSSQKLTGRLDDMYFFCPESYIHIIGGTNM